MSTNSDSLNWTTTLRTFKASPLLFTIQRICILSALFVVIFTIKDVIQNNTTPTHQNIFIVILFTTSALLIRTPQRHITIREASLEVGDSIFGIPTSYKEIVKNEKSTFCRRKQNKRWTGIEIINDNSAQVLTYIKTNSVDEILLTHKLKSPPVKSEIVNE